MTLFQVLLAQMREWTATTTSRLDIFLANEKAALSRLKARNLVREGFVLVNGRIARKAALVLKEGDVVQVSVDGEKVTETRIEPIDLKLEVLYEDDACMVIRKPAGISVHPGAGIPKDAATILNGVAFLFKKRNIPFSSSAVLVHRLDKDTTGCLLIGKTPEAHKMLQKQFENRTVKKFYLAIVAGVPEKSEAIIDASIGRSSTDRKKMTVIGSSTSREARTTYRVLSASKTAALLECELHTGRTHQIRVHLHAIGHPILGDPTYQTVNSDRLARELEIKSVCLHAFKLTFVSPADSKEHEIICSPPESIQVALNDIQLQLVEKK